MSPYASRAAGTTLPVRTEIVNGTPVPLYASPHHIHGSPPWIATSALLDALRVPVEERYAFSQRHRLNDATHSNIVLAPGRRVSTVAPPAAELAIYAQQREGVITTAEADALRAAVGIAEELRV